LDSFRKMMRTLQGYLALWREARQPEPEVVSAPQASP
jgi:hypothetical protein